MIKNSDVTLSFEIFPPNTLDGVIKLDETCKFLNQFNPEFFSVTFGASGSSQWKTQHLVHHLAKNNIRVAPHISCINLTKQEIDKMLHEYIQLDIKHLVVIRGDYPTSDECKFFQEFHFANELVNYIQVTTCDHFHITVAAYPEFHPQAISPEDDLQNFKRKIEAGANCAITQCFFNTDAYFRFLDDCQSLNINVSIIPGILPITDYNKLQRFSKVCGAEIPLWLRKRLESYEDTDSLQAFGIEMTTRLCEQLLSRGVKRLHFYTLNQINPTISTLKNLNL